MVFAGVTETHLLTVHRTAHVCGSAKATEAPFSLREPAHILSRTEFKGQNRREVPGSLEEFDCVAQVRNSQTFPQH